LKPINSISQVWPTLKIVTFSNNASEGLDFHEKYSQALGQRLAKRQTEIDCTLMNGRSLKLPLLSTTFEYFLIPE
jgi:hypothetical protein